MTKTSATFARSLHFLAATMLLGSIVSESLAQGRRGGGNDPLRGRITVGTTVPGFKALTAHAPDGTEVQIAQLVPQGGRLVVVTGCLTCPKFLNSYRGVEALAHDYRETKTEDSTEPISFVYLYKSLAHPENGGWIQPFTLEERLAQVIAAQKQLATKVNFIVDPMDNSVSAALGGSPNSATIIDDAGRVLYVSGWADAATVRTTLATMIGPADSVSTPEDIGVPSFARPSRNRGEVVPSVKVSGTMNGLKTAPAESKEPHYVKLRAEVEPSVLQGNAGKMYLGFHLDPVHGVHWNNLVDPVAWTLELPESIVISPAQGKGPKVEPATDHEPREFLIDIESWKPGTSIECEVHYFACSEKEGWCKPVSQRYTITLQRDSTAGMATGRWQRGGSGGERERRGGNMGEMIARMDTNGDGKIARAEAPERMQQRFDMFDTNGDGFIAEDEMEQLRQRMGQRRGGTSQEQPTRQRGTDRPRRGRGTS